ncbi:LytS/YhcK type 5TM receptor domain-containing protein [Paenibacillus prosopidis]|uniref:Two-component system sensor histidine kinase LytS n=1 Tax=Paenibacillus prosopidis TaxID=630520 RepID=A0A368W8L4_9BACL|nr:LytS/YhcK type 5TM receptor domain-containing protein [Paenibacillus prosopidis]RCW52081.1 two-component system sensor histidine kinase LytS [Paenibacillus prosopidis]
MEQLTLVLFERIGMLLILMFILTRIPLFRNILDRDINLRTGIVFAVLFGLIGIVGTYAGVAVSSEETGSAFWVTSLAPDEMMAHSALIGIVMAGLLGGVYVGAGAGLLTGLHAYVLGGLAGASYAISSPLIGLLAGFVARFFYEERIIAPVKAMFIGVFAPILQMGVLLIVTTSSETAIELVNRVGVPMVITNSIGIALFVAMIQVALREEERAAAHETQRAFTITEMVLPHLKQGLSYETARETAAILLRELHADAVGVTDTERILAHAGIGTSRHVPGESIVTELSRTAIRTGMIQIAANREQIQPHHPDLGAAIIVPFNQSGRTAGLIKLYFRSPKQIRKVEVEFAYGLRKLISSQLTSAMGEKLEALMKDAELRVLQAQINPHFLFNTLNSIVTLIRIDPDHARHMTVQLGHFMRMNLTMTQSPLVPLYREMEHLNTYLEIIRIRFADQLKVECVSEPNLEMVLIPPSTLQPLVENSIQHGLKKKTNGGWVRIELKREGNAVRIIVEDNGEGIPGGLLDKLGTVPMSGSGSTGLGVHNVNQRLISLLGPEASLTYGNRPESGARVTFAVPYGNGEWRGKVNEA